MNRNKIAVTETSQHSVIYRLHSDITISKTARARMLFLNSFQSTWEIYFTSLDHYPQKTCVYKYRSKVQKTNTYTWRNKGHLITFHIKGVLKCFPVMLTFTLRALLIEDLLHSEVQHFWEMCYHFFKRTLEEKESCLSPAGIANSLYVFFRQ